MEGKLEVVEFEPLRWPSRKLDLSGILKFVEKWIYENFEDSDFVDFDFSDWDNEAELLDDIEEFAIPLDELIDEVGYPNKDVEISQKINEFLREKFDGKCLFYPTERRVHVEEVWVAPQSLEQLQNLVPSLLKDLEFIEEHLPEGIGHNGAPGTERLNRAEIEELRFRLSKFQTASEMYVQENESWFRDLAKRIVSFCGQVSRALGDKTAIYLNAVLEESGKQTGKVLPYALALSMASKKLDNFGVELVRYLTSLGGP